MGAIGDCPRGLELAESELMSEASNPSTANDIPVTPAAKPLSHPVGAPMDILRAITDPMRHGVLRELANGSYPSVMALAKKLACHPDMMGRHLQQLKKAGLVIRVNPGKEADQRSKYYQIPTKFRSTLPDGARVLDFGSVVLRFEGA